MTKLEIWLLIALVAIIAYSAGWWGGQGGTFFYVGPRTDMPQKVLIKFLF